MLTLKVFRSLSISYLISILTTCSWNLDKIVFSRLYKILSFLAKPFLTKFWCHFERRYCNWNNSLKTIIFQCSKKYGTSTLGTRLKVTQTWQTQLVLTKRDRSLKAIGLPWYQREMEVCFTSLQGVVTIPLENGYKKWPGMTRSICKTVHVLFWEKYLVCQIGETCTFCQNCWLWWRVLIICFWLYTLLNDQYTIKCYRTKLTSGRTQ